MSTTLQDFVTTMVAKSRITFGDVRRLQRDCLPAGILCREDAEILLVLDAQVERTDRAWAGWLIAAMIDFAVCEQPLDVSGIEAWLESLLATSGATAEMRRRILRDARREARARETAPAWDEQSEIEDAADEQTGEGDNDLALAA